VPVQGCTLPYLYLLCSVDCTEATSLYNFRGLISGNELTQLDLSQNGLLSVPSTAIRNLHRLMILNLNNNKITAIHNIAFEGLDTLEILFLYGNKIKIVESDAFKGLDK
jgi:Leucine-rich repeat (LRR) protein